jgi:hypothetical protein
MANIERLVRYNEMHDLDFGAEAEFCPICEKGLRSDTG